MGWLQLTCSLSDHSMEYHDYISFITLKTLESSRTLCNIIRIMVGLLSSAEGLYNIPTIEYCNCFILYIIVPVQSECCRTVCTVVPMLTMDLRCHTTVVYKHVILLVARYYNSRTPSPTDSKSGKTFHRRVPVPGVSAAQFITLASKNWLYFCTLLYGSHTVLVSRSGLLATAVTVCDSRIAERADAKRADLLLYILISLCALCRRSSQVINHNNFSSNTNTVLSVSSIPAPCY